MSHSSTTVFNPGGSAVFICVKNRGVN